MARFACSTRYSAGVVLEARAVAVSNKQWRAEVAAHAESQAPRRTRHAGNLGTEVSREEPHTPKPLAKTLYIEYLRLWL